MQTKIFCGIYFLQFFIELFANQYLAGKMRLFPFTQKCFAFARAVI